MDPVVLLEPARRDADDLLSAAAREWGRPIPHCPEWDAAELVRHTGSILQWMEAIVTSRERVVRRTLNPPPQERAELSAWYLANLDRTLALLGSSDPESATWTFSSSGNQRVGWWMRRLAVEVAVHRWDVEYAAGVDGGSNPRPVDRRVAAAGIEEFMVEFLPQLVSRESVVGLHGTLELQPTDGNEWWGTNLDAPTSRTVVRGEASCRLRATSSDLLLWLNNRRRADSLEASGDVRIVEAWQQLRF